MKSKKSNGQYPKQPHNQGIIEFSFKKFQSSLKRKKIETCIANKHSISNYFHM
jgi:hypothetical protein